jgi:hypothetical protein
MGYIFQLLAIACEEDSTGARAVSNANHIALYIRWTVIRALERLIISSLTDRCVCHRELVPS